MVNLVGNRHKIAIVGAGPAGLTLARILARGQCTDITVLELEQSRSARSQGGSTVRLAKLHSKQQD